MRVTYEQPAVNERRYGAVWIAKVVSWPIGKPPTIEFGGKVTYDKAEISAQPGDLCRAGRKDHRGNNTVSEYFIVEADGSLRNVTADEARDHWLASNGGEP